MERVADYDKQGYDYTRYWQDSQVARDYEDAAERIAIRRMLPLGSRGGFFLDLGGGFGRLTDEYSQHYDQLILSDYSLDSLKRASTIPYRIALNAYHLPFRDNTINGLQTIRMMHHIENADLVIAEIARITSPGGSALIEYANKRHFLSIMRYLLTRRGLNPFSLTPEDHSDLFFNFHPRWIEDKIQNHGLIIRKVLSVSNFRHRIFKKIIPRPALLLLERALQIVLSPLRFAPSIFVLGVKNGVAPQVEPGHPELHAILCCPSCRDTSLIFSDTQVVCPACAKSFPIIDGIYDFRI